jgi:hypothetical protein
MLLPEPPIAPDTLPPVTVHEKVVPTTLLINCMSVVPPEQNVGVRFIAVRVGILGCALTIILVDAGEIHPAELVTVKVYVLAFAVTNPVGEILTTPGVKV